jgi:L-lactate dehydrogenase complex protein LldG
VVALAMSAAAREQILGAVRAALGTTRTPMDDIAPGPTPAALPAGAPELVELFCERVGDYQATVSRVEAEDVAGAVAGIAARHRARRLVVPAGLPVAWRPAGLERVDDHDELSARELERFDGAVTGAGLAIAETGTIVLDGGSDQGRRWLTLLPDLHICIVQAARVVADVPDAIAILGGLVRSQRRAVTLVSGPSATADIELRRVHGVHGPRRLEVVVASGV